MGSYEASFSFLNDQSFVLAINETVYDRSDSWRLEVHTFADQQTHSTRIAELSLPPFKTGAGVLLSAMLIRSDPNDAGPEAQVRQPQRGTGNRTGNHDLRPFLPSPDERILVLSCSITHQGGHTPAFLITNRLSIIMQASTILSIALNLRSGNRVAAWEDWGPPATRWSRQWLQNAFVTDVHGQRYLTTTANWEDEPVLSILDFNPYAIRRDTACHLASPGDEWEYDNEVQTRVVHESTVVALPYAFKEPIVSSLPYRETFYPTTESLESGISAFCLDDERILIFNVCRCTTRYIATL